MKQYSNILLILPLIGFVNSMYLHTPSHKSFRKTKFERNENNINTNDKITNAKNLFACISEGSCHSITEYRISSENSFSCYDQNILIDLTSLKNLTEGNKMPYGFLTRDRAIIESQTTTRTCLRIKRYFFT